MSLKLLNKINLIYNAGIVYIVIIAVVCIPLSLYSLRRLMSIKSNIIFKKRHGKISQMFVITSIVIFTISPHDILSRDLYIGGCEYGLRVGYHMFLFNQHNWTLLTALFVLKVWMNYYDINYSKTIIDNEWKSLIDPNITKKDRDNWFLKHRTTYGSAQYLLKYVLLFCVTSWAVNYIPFIVNYSSFVALCPLLFDQSEPTAEQTKSAYSVLLGIWAPARAAQMICYVLIIIIRHKTVKFEDNFFIRQEIKYIALAAVTYAAIECVYQLIEEVLISVGIIPKNSASWGIITRACHNFVGFLSLVTLCVIIWIQTLWFMKKNEKWLVYFERIERTLNVASARDAVELRPLSLFNRKSNKNNVGLSTINLAKIEDDNMAQKKPATHSKTSSHIILNTEKGFRSFMYHLSYEFSVEILISLLEFYHYKKYIYEHPLFILEERDSEDIEVERYFEIFSKEYIPQSYIVYGNKEHVLRDYHSVYAECIENLQITNMVKEKEKFKLLFECMISSHQLFIKYIQNGARAEINISFTMRGILNNMFCGKNHRHYDTLHTQLCGNEYSESESFEAFIGKRTDIASEYGILSEINTLYHVFDDCCEDMLKLVDYSFERFRESTLFQKVQEHL